jgi:hypothetical protein
VGKLTVKFVWSEKNEAELIWRSNISVKLLDVLAKNVWEGNIFAWQKWDDIVWEIDTHNMFCTQALVQRENVKMWLRGVTRGLQGVMRVWISVCTMCVLNWRESRRTRGSDVPGGMKLSHYEVRCCRTVTTQRCQGFTYLVVRQTSSIYKGVWCMLEGLILLYVHDQPCAKIMNSDVGKSSCNIWGLFGVWGCHL